MVENGLMGEAGSSEVDPVDGWVPGLSVDDHESPESGHDVHNAVEEDEKESNFYLYLLDGADVAFLD